MNNEEKNNEDMARSELQEMFKKFLLVNKKSVEMSEIMQALKDLSNEAFMLLIKITKECWFIQQNFSYGEQYRLLSGETIKEAYERNHALALIVDSPEQMYLAPEKNQFPSSFSDNWRNALENMLRQEIDNGKVDEFKIVDEESLKDAFKVIVKDKNNLGECINNYFMDLINMNNWLNQVRWGFSKRDNNILNIKNSILDSLGENEFQDLAKYLYENEICNEMIKSALWSNVFEELSSNAYEGKGLYLLASAVGEEAKKDTDRERKIWFSHSCYNNIRQRINKIEDFNSLLSLGLNGLFKKNDVIPSFKSWGCSLLNQIADHKELEDGAWGLEVNKDEIRLKFNALEMHGVINRFLLSSNSERKNFLFLRDVEERGVEDLKKLYSYHSSNYWAEMMGRVFNVILKEVSPAIISIQENGNKSELWLDIKTRDTVETLNVIEHFMSKALVTKVENTEELESLFRPYIEEFIIKRDMEKAGNLINVESQDRSLIKKPKKF